jgi:hypothetical protein
MTTYRVPDQSPYRTSICIVLSTAIFITLALLLATLLNDRIFIPDSTRRGLAILVLMILFGCIGILTVLSAKEKYWKENQQGLEFELSDDKLIERRNGTLVNEIPRENITFVAHIMGQLVVRGAPSSRGILIPKHTIGFPQLKDALTASTTVAKPIPNYPFIPLLGPGICFAACVFVLIAKNTIVLFSAGAVLVLAQIWFILFLLRISKKKPVPKILLFSYFGSILFTVWIVYMRFTGT